MKRDSKSFNEGVTAYAISVMVAVDGEICSMNTAAQTSANACFTKKSPDYQAGIQDCGC